MQPAPSRFNLARYCLGAGEPRPPEKVALSVVTDGDNPEQARRWSFAELDTAVRATAAALLDQGFRPGERIVLRLGNSSDFPLTYFGAIAAGLIAVPTSAQLTADEFAVLLSDCEPAATITAPELDLPGVGRTITVEDLANWRLAYAGSGGYADTRADDAAFLVYTSGTTGRPKGVLHAHRSAWGRRPMYAGWSGLGPQDVMLHAGELNWTYTLGVGLTDPWAVGAAAVVYSGPRDPGIWGGLIAATGASLFAAVPGVYRQLLARGIDRADLTTLRHGLTAGEALAPSLLEQWRQATGLELYEALGMSEISTFISSGPLVPVKPASPGKPQAGRRVAVLPTDSEGTVPLSPGQTGLLAVHRSDPGLMLGYWRRPEERPWRGEWFVTPDLVQVDPEGYVIHHGRVDDVMNSLGYRVGPLEVEQVLANHPAIADVAVTDVVVREGVSIICAFVVPADPQAQGGHDPAAILGFAREHLAAYKCPKKVVFVERLPRTGNGKVQRQLLRRDFR